MECTTSALVTGRASLAGSRIRSGIACNMAAGALWGLVFLAPEVVRDFGPCELRSDGTSLPGHLGCAPRTTRKRARRQTRLPRLVRADPALADEHVGVTRGKRMVVALGQRKAVAVASGAAR